MKKEAITKLASKRISIPIQMNKTALTFKKIGMSFYLLKRYLAFTLQNSISAKPTPFLHNASENERSNW